NIENLDAIVVTHAHLDHCGLVPLLFKYGYDGPVYASEPTIPLMALLQMDYINVVEKNGAQPPYSYSEIKEELLHAIPLKYGMVSDIAPDIKLTLYNAGHILGSSIVHLHITEGVHNIVFTGDFKYGRTLLLNPAYSDIARAETLVIESTYGDPGDIMPDREAVERNFIELVNSTLKARGKVLIPTPAAGRAQEIMIVIDKYMRAGLLAEVPVFIEGLINEASYIHMSYPTYLSREVSAGMIEGSRNPFTSEYFTVITNAGQRDEVVSGGPCIIIATSGMMEGGPVIDYFARLADDERNALVFVSYQVPGTLGNRLLSGLRQVNIVQEGKLTTINVRLKVASVEGFSGHSDRKQLLRYVAKLRPKVRNVIVTHGEPTKVNALAHSITRIFKLNTLAPSILETTTLVPG
ncbi:MAG TPA: beta-CASP ribonuclease aCPSF1, partial [Chromatiaceae bacterium]|nr:beta-CASP ribonuclease aCPSF1 [Chromatiaceae bacterium]